MNVVSVCCWQYNDSVSNTPCVTIEGDITLTIPYKKVSSCSFSYQFGVLWFRNCLTFLLFLNLLLFHSDIIITQFPQHSPNLLQVGETLPASYSVVIPKEEGLTMTGKCKTLTVDGKGSQSELSIRWNVFTIDFEFYGVSNVCFLCIQLLFKTLINYENWS